MATDNATLQNLETRVRYLQNYMDPVQNAHTYRPTIMIFVYRGEKTDLELLTVQSNKPREGGRKDWGPIQGGINDVETPEITFRGQEDDPQITQYDFGLFHLAAYRELYEEARIPISDLTDFEMYPGSHPRAIPSRKKRKENGKTYHLGKEYFIASVRYRGDGDFIAQESEVGTVRFFSEHQFKQYIRNSNEWTKLNIILQGLKQLKSGSEYLRTTRIKRLEREL